jgi:hypothetical protein
MNVEIWAEAAQFPEKEYISGVLLAVWTLERRPLALIYNCLAAKE